MRISGDGTAGGGSGHSLGASGPYPSPNSRFRASGVEVSARPSDAIALALRTGTPIYGSDTVLDDAGIAIPDEQEDEVEKFREFLDQISPEDFGTSNQ